MEVLLMTEPSGARLPTGKQTVGVRPRERARSGDMMTSSGSMPSLIEQILAQRVAAWAVLPPVEVGVEGFAGDGLDGGVEQAGAAQVEHDFGHAAGEEDLHGGEVARAVGQGVDQARDWRLMWVQSSAVGRCSPAAWAMAGMCSRRLVEPPKAAWTTMALSMEAWVRMSRVPRLQLAAGAGWRGRSGGRRRARWAGRRGRARCGAGRGPGLRRRLARWRRCPGTGSRRRGRRRRGSPFRRRLRG